MNILEAIEKPKDKKFIDLEGETFGYWYVTAYAGKWGNKQKPHYWYCKCVCGHYKLITGNSLRREMTKSCGCKRKEREELVGKNKDKLLIIKDLGLNESGRRIFLCSCDCGKEVIRTFDSLKGNFFSSCGCYVKQNLSKKNIEDLSNLKFGRLTAIELAPFKKAARWLCKCECGNEIITLAKSLKHGVTKSCGCLNEDKIKERVGEKHPNYNPNLTEEDRIKRRYKNIKETREWRMLVFTRDSFQCQVCETKGVKLNAHHMNSYHWCEEERFDVNNGVTLCECCHKKFHKKYGYKNNTKEQFKEFVALKGGENN